MEEQLRGIFGALDALGPIEVHLIETVALLVVLGVLRLLLGTLVGRQVADERARYHWRKGVTYALALIGIFGVGRIWFEGMRAITTFLGLVAAGLVLALKEPVSNVAAWFFMLWRRPFTIGDRVQVGSVSGDVIDQRLFVFSLLEIGNWVAADQSTGRIVHVPNGRVFTEPVFNYTRDFPYLWNEIPIVVTFESNWQAASELLTEIGDRHARALTAEDEARVLAQSKRSLIFYSTLAPFVYTSVTERGIVLTLRYLCEVRARRGTSHRIWQEILTAFAARDDIDFAYPTWRVFDREAEERTLRP